MSFSQFLKELKRRNVYRVAMTYLVVAWVVLQVVTIIAPIIEAPAWVSKLVLIVLIVCFPVALIFAWAYKISPQGITRTSAPDIDEPKYPEIRNKNHRYNFIIGFLLVLITGQFVYHRYFTSNDQSPPADKSIAVLPFVNESSNQENQYFCNGIMNGILENLSKIEELVVFSRSSVEPFRNGELSSAEIGARLGVSYLVEGSVQRIGDRVAIFTELILADDQKQLWSRRFERDLNDVFAVQAEVTESIAAELHSVLAPELKKRIENIPTTSTAAYDYYLQGREYLFEADPETQGNEVWKDLMLKAKAAFDLAISSDSSFAEPWAGLARVAYLRDEEAEILSEDYLDEVVMYASKALDINENLGEAYFLRGQAHYRNSRIEKAKRDLTSCLILSPNNIEALNLQMEIGRFIDLDFKEAVVIGSEIEKRVNSPSDTWDLYYNLWSMCFQVNSLDYMELFAVKLENTLPNRFSGKYWVLERQGRMDEAWDNLQSEFTEDNQFGLLIKGEHFLHQNMFEKSLQYYERWYELVSQESEDNWLSVNDWHRFGQALFGVGQTDRGREMLEKQIEINSRKVALNRTGFSGLSPYYDLAGIYSFLGNKEEAYRWLDEFGERKGWIRLGLLFHVQRDHLFDNLRSDQRFQELLARIELREAQYRKQMEESLRNSKLTM